MILHSSHGSGTKPVLINTENCVPNWPFVAAVYGLCHVIPACYAQVRLNNALLQKNNNLVLAGLCAGKSFCAQENDYLLWLSLKNHFVGDGSRMLVLISIIAVQTAH